MIFTLNEIDEILRGFFLPGSRTVIKFEESNVSSCLMNMRFSQKSRNKTV